MAGPSISSRSVPRRLLAGIARFVAVMLAIGGAYVVAGWSLALIPRNAGWRPAGQGVTIWVEDNGVHTSLVLPKQAAGIDWRADFPARDLRDPRYGDHAYVAVGWGERHFYLGTPTWSDVRASTVLRAALGSDDTLLHVEHVARPTTGDDAREVTLSVTAYRRLAAAIRASRGTGGVIAGYDRYDVFYPAIGRYDALHTCNDWTSDTLARVGVRVGWWTPFAGGVMRWFPR
ncbi:TIGR02117 family protein [Sphingomonas endophytica]|uniref:TIGR02117 family protein n=1 Tax=Sphingomonas endophytica TaxID=869719 RepID=UPI001F4C82F8|nr:TIGR02117 family protein [Sphingomonas endophytica]